jgi:hypothetical protein
MWNDLVVEEIRKYRDEYAKQFNYNFHAICQDIRKKQGQNGRRVVSLNPRPAKHIPNPNSQFFKNDC